jgi:hypothetical protein
MKFSKAALSGEDWAPFDRDEVAGGGRLRDR